MLLITANPKTIPLDGSSIITFEAREMTGVPVLTGTEIRFSTAMGRIADVVTTDRDGVARATLQVDGRAGSATVTASRKPRWTTWMPDKDPRRTTMPTISDTLKTQGWIKVESDTGGWISHNDYPHLHFFPHEDGNSAHASAPHLDTTMGPLQLSTKATINIAINPNNKINAAALIRSLEGKTRRENIVHTYDVLFRKGCHSP